MRIEVKHIDTSGDVYVQWDNRCSVCWQDQTALCNNANCDGVRN